MMKMKGKLSLKLIVALAIKQDGLTYKELSEITKYHINTVSRYVSYLDGKNMVEIRQRKSDSIRGRKWVNIVKLKKEFLEAKNIADFFNKIIKQSRGELSDIFTN